MENNEKIEKMKEYLKKQIKISYPSKRGKYVRKSLNECIEDDNAAEFMYKALSDLDFSLETDANFLAKAIGAYIRLGMEDFHSEHLSDTQMKELNPIIRNSVYTFIKDYNDDKILKISGVLKCNLPSYWEDCVYDKEIG